MKKYDIPHPKYFACKNKEEVCSAKEKSGFTNCFKGRWVSSWKRCYYMPSEEDFQKALSSFYDSKSFGKLLKKYLLKNVLLGPEISIFTVCNGSDYKIINNAQDHKRASR